MRVWRVVLLGAMIAGLFGGISLTAQADINKAGFVSQGRINSSGALMQGWVRCDEGDTFRMNVRVKQGHIARADGSLDLTCTGRNQNFQVQTYYDPDLGTFSAGTASACIGERTGPGGEGGFTACGDTNLLSQPGT